MSARASRGSGSLLSPPFRFFPRCVPPRLLFICTSRSSQKRRRRAFAQLRNRQAVQRPADFPLSPSTESSLEVVS